MTTLPEDEWGSAKISIGLDEVFTKENNMTTKLETKIEEVLTLRAGKYYDLVDMMKEISRWTLEQVMPEEKVPKKYIDDINDFYSYGYNMSREDMKLKAQELGIIN